MDIHPFQDPIDSDIEIVERLWKKTGCIMYRRLSLFLSDMIFRGEKSRGFGEGGVELVETVHGVQFLDAYCHALLSAESTAITASRGGSAEKDEREERRLPVDTTD